MILGGEEGSCERFLGSRGGHMSGPGGELGVVRVVPGRDGESCEWSYRGGGGLMRGLRWRVGSYVWSKMDGVGLRSGPRWVEGVS